MVGVVRVLGEIGVADFLEVEGDLVFAEVAGERDAVAVGDFPADAGFADGDGAVAGDLAEELVAALDLELVEAGQQRAEADQHEGGQQIEAESVAGFHGISVARRRRPASGLIEWSQAFAMRNSSQKTSGENEHGEERGVDHLQDGGAGEHEIAADEVDDGVFRREIEEARRCRRAARRTAICPV